MLENILCLCYPVAKPKLADLAGLASLLEVIMKYEMMGILTLFIPELTIYADGDPLKVWAIACRCGPVVEDVALSAASRMAVMSKNCNHLPPLRLLKSLLNKEGIYNLHGISAGHYYRLLEHVGARGSTKLLQLPPLIAPNDSSETPPSLEDFIPRFPPPDVTIQCSDGTQHRAHIIFLARRAHPRCGQPSHVQP